MSPQAKWEYMKAVYPRYHLASKKEKVLILNEFCKTYRCHRKHAIRLLTGPPPAKKRSKRHRTSLYGSTLTSLLEALWESSRYLCSQRLKATIPLWFPWIKKHFPLNNTLERHLLSISSAQIERKLQPKKRILRKRIYGTTRPGSLLKQHIPIKTDSWDITLPGFMEVDLVSHSGPSAEGSFAYTLTMTDILTGWVERRAFLGKGHAAVVAAIDDIVPHLPFLLRGIDSDNGSEFLNHHLHSYCSSRTIRFTRSRPYKKDDNAHVEQKNWTHVRKLVGYQRYDSSEAVATLNDLYVNELRSFQNLFQPSVKLLKKVRIGSKLTRKYDSPKTPLQRLIDSQQAEPAKQHHLLQCIDSLDPFVLSVTIDKKITSLLHLATKEVSSYSPLPLSPVEANSVRQKSWENFSISRTAPHCPVHDSFKQLRCHPIGKLKKIYQKEAALQLR
jgi:hypothetical protein